MVASTTAPKKPGPRQAATDRWHNYKVCGSCGKNKRMTEFAFAGGWRKKRAANPKRYKSDCKECTRAPSAAQTDPDFVVSRSRKVYPKNRTDEEKRASAASYKRAQRRATRIKALAYLAEKGCCECGERDPRVLEFDHIEPREKEHDVAKLFSDGYSWGAEKLRAEIRKCRVICANCHRRHTVQQQEYYSHEDVASALQQIDEHYDIS